MKRRPPWPSGVARFRVVRSAFAPTWDILDAFDRSCGTVDVQRTRAAARAVADAMNRKAYDQWLAERATAVQS